MSKKMQKHEYLERDKIEQLKQREREFEHKRKLIEMARKEREHQEMLGIEYKLRSLEDKLGNH
jgi:hypothetical protein